MQLRAILSPLLILTVGLLMSAAFVACGFDDFEVDFDTLDDSTEQACEAADEACEDDDSRVLPPDGNGEHPVSTYPAMPSSAAEDEGASIEEEPDEPQGPGESSEQGGEQEPAPEEEITEQEEPMASPDLQCGDDPEICRFCGPPVEVVSDCSPGDSSFECQVFELVNEERAANGLNQVTYNATLAESAMIHAMDLSMCNYFAHDSLDGTSFFERCAANGYPGTCTGENIGGGQTTAEAVFDAWMASPGHRDNILYPHHEELGVAYYEGSGTYSRYWLKHFGRP